MKTVKIELVLLISMLSLISCGDGKKDPTETIQKVAAASDKLWAALQNSDADGFAAMLTENVVIMSPDGDDIRGREQFSQFARKAFPTMKVSNFKVITRVIDLSDSLAYELTTYSETLKFDGQEPRDARGRYLMVWKQDENGQWLLHKNLYNYYGPKAPE